MTTHNWRAFLVIKKKFDQAEDHFRQAISAMCQNLGERHIRLARLLTDYIVALKALKKKELIHEHATTVVDIESQSFGADSPKLCNSLATLGLGGRRCRPAGSGEVLS